MVETLIPSVPSACASPGRSEEFCDSPSERTTMCLVFESTLRSCSAATRIAGARLVPPPDAMDLILFWIISGSSFLVIGTMRLGCPENETTVTISVGSRTPIAPAAELFATDCWERDDPMTDRCIDPEESSTNATAAWVVTTSSGISRLTGSRSAINPFSSSRVWRSGAFHPPAPRAS